MLLQFLTPQKSLFSTKCPLIEDHVLPLAMNSCLASHTLLCHLCYLYVYVFKSMVKLTPGQRPLLCLKVELVFTGVLLKGKREGGLKKS